MWGMRDTGRKKAATMALAIMLLATALSGSALLLTSFSSSAAPPSGDWLISDAQEVSEHISYGNITIAGEDAVLKVSGGRLLMASNNAAGRDLTITVRDGGTLHLDNSLLGSLLNFVEGSSPVLTVLVESGGTLLAENDSILKFPGHILVDNGELIIIDSEIRGMADSESGDPTGDIEYYCNQDDFPADRFGHSPVITLFSSYFLLQNSSIADLQEGGALDSGVWTANYDFLTDDGQRDEVSYTLGRRPVAISAGTGDIEDLWAEDGERMVIGPGDTVETAGFDIGGLLFNTGEATVKLNALYRAEQSGATLKGYHDGTEVASLALVDSTSPSGLQDGVVSAALLAALPSWDLAGLELTLENTGSGDIEIDRVWLSIEIALPAFRNITLAAGSELMLIDSTLGIDHSGEPETHNTLAIRDTSRAEIYGLTCEEGTGQPFANAITPAPKQITLLTSKTSSEHTAAATNLNDLLVEDGTTYPVAAGETFEVVFSASGLSGEISETKLVTVADATGSNTKLQWSLDGIEYYSTDIRPNAYLAEYDALLSVDALEDLERLLVRCDVEPAEAFGFDYLAIEVTTQPRANIYKWADVTVLGDDSQPMADVAVEAFRQDGGQWDGTPPQEVLDYLDALELEHEFTDENGLVRLPLLADTLIGGALVEVEVSSSTYRVLATAQGSSGPLMGQESVSFKPYPYLIAGSNDDTIKPVSISISGTLADLSVSAPRIYNAAGDLLTDDPTPAGRTETLTIEFDVSNLGMATAQDFLVELMDGDQPVYAELVESLSAWGSSGDSQTLSFEWEATSPIGVRELRIVVDRQSMVLDLDPLNNEQVFDVEVLLAPTQTVDDPLAIYGSSWMITDAVEIIEFVSYDNITIAGEDAVLKVSNGRLLMASNHLLGRDLSITVRDGGTLHLDNSLLGSLLSAGSGSSPVLTVRVESGGKLIAENNSVLKFPGHLLVDRGELTIIDSEIRGMVNSEARDPTGDIGYYCDSSVFPADRFGHSPVITLFSSDFLLQNSIIRDLQKGGSLGSNAWTADYGFLKDDRWRDDVTYVLSRDFGSFVGDDDPEMLVAMDGERYTIADSEELELGDFDNGGLLFAEGGAGLALNVIYRAGLAFTGANLVVSHDGNVLQTVALEATEDASGERDVQVKVDLPGLASWELSDLEVLIANNGGEDIEVDCIWLSVELKVPAYRNITLAGDSAFMLIDSYIGVDHTAAPGLHSTIAVRDNSQAELYGFSCEEGDGWPFADPISILPTILPPEVSTSPEVHLYKWSELTVQNEVGGLLAGVEVEAFTTDILTGSLVPARYWDGSAWDTVPPQEVLDYLGSGADYQFTDEHGAVKLPLLTDVIAADPSARSSHSYILKLTALTAGDPIEGQVSVTFDHYPYLGSGSNGDVMKALSITLDGALPDLCIPEYQIYDRDGNLVLDSNNLQVGDPPLEVSRTDRVEIEFELINRGAAGANGFLVRIYDGEGEDAVLLDTIEIDHLGPWADSAGRSRTESFEWVATHPAGIHNLRIVVDEDEMIPDVNPGNNCWVIELDVLPAAELRIDGPNLIIDEDDGAQIVLDFNNIGDADINDYQVYFYVNGILVDTVTSPAEPLTPNRWARAAYNYDHGGVAGPLVVRVVFSSPELLDDVDVEKDLGVDLKVESVQTNKRWYAPGENITVSILVRNNGVYDVLDARLELTVLQGGNLVTAHTLNPASIAAGASESVPFVLQGLDPDNGPVVVDYIVVVRANQGDLIPESDFGNNEKSYEFYIDDERADLFVENLNTGATGDKGPIGKPLTISFDLKNGGKNDASRPLISIYMEQAGVRTLLKEYEVQGTVPKAGSAQGNSIPISFQYTLDGEVGTNSLVVVLNENRAIAESDYTNNEEAKTFQLSALEPQLQLRTSLSNFKVGDDIYVFGEVVNKHNTSQRLPNVTISLDIYNQGKLVNTISFRSSESGRISEFITVNELMAGSTQMFFSIDLAGQQHTQSISVTVASSLDGGGADWLLWAIIAAVMLILILLFSFYIYRYSLGKMVECGECGSLIPEAASRCPNCGVDFEVGTAKCSECSSWIPSNSKKCPECGTSFIGTITSDEEESEYIQLMREGYGHYVDVYREQAQEEMGKKYNDQRFLRWWTEHPSYVSFEDWLSQEEAERKEKTFKCPSCGSMNAQGMTQCVRCGRDFSKHDADLVEEPAPIRRVVVRRRKGAEELLPEEGEEGDDPDIRERIVLKDEPEIEEAPPRKRSLFRREPKEPEPEAPSAEEAPAEPILRKRSILRREPKEEPEPEESPAEEESVDEPAEQDEPAAEPVEEEPPVEEVAEEEDTPTADDGDEEISEEEEPAEEVDESEEIDDEEEL